MEQRQRANIVKFSKPESYEIPIWWKETLWKHNYPVMMTNQILFCGKRHSERPITHLYWQIRKVMKFQFCGKRSYEKPITHLCWQTKRLWNSYFCGKRHYRKNNYPVMLINQKRLWNSDLWKRDIVEKQSLSYDHKSGMIIKSVLIIKKRNGYEVLIFGQRPCRSQ